MFAIIAVVIVVLLVALLGLAAIQPSAFKVERTTNIHAPAGKVFALINDFHGWGAWSPWEELDPTMKKTFSGSDSGAGAVYEWDGNMKVGKGRMEITGTNPPSKVTIKLDFFKPMEGHNIAEFTLEPQGESTNVRWSIHGQSAFAAKVMRVFVSMDTMMGRSFETGLANLKAIAEK